MQLHFHHFFIFVARDAPPVDQLQKAGFLEGSRNVHAGQGTANRRIFLENGMLEFIWVESPIEIRSPITSPTRLWERSLYATSKYSPFGIGLCPSEFSDKAIEEPFVGQPYQPSYLPPGMNIWNASQHRQPWEPMIFYLPFAKPYDLSQSSCEPIQHPNGARRIRKIVLTLASQEGVYSDAIHKLAVCDMIQLKAGHEPHAEIKLQGLHSCHVDLRPLSPLELSVVTA